MEEELTTKLQELTHASTDDKAVKKSVIDAQKVIHNKLNLVFLIYISSVIYISVSINTRIQSFWYRPRQFPMSLTIHTGYRHFAHTVM